MSQNENALATINLSEHALLELASNADRLKMPGMAQDWLNKAILASQNGGYYDVSMPPGLTNAPGMGTASEMAKGLTHVGTDSPIIRSIKQNGFKPQPTPYRISDALLTLGHYNGIRELDQATSRTFMAYKQVATFPLIDAIIGFKIAEVLPFFDLPTNQRKYGFEIGLKDRKAPVSPRARKRIDDLTHLLLHGGFLQMPDGSRRRHSRTGEPGVWDGLEQEKAMRLQKFVQCYLRDSFSMDWACARTEPGRMKDKYPIAFMAPVASEMIRRTVRDYYQPAIMKDHWIEYVELNPGLDGQVVREFTWDRMFSMVRRPRTDFYGRGYGVPEVDVLLQEIAAMRLNLKFEKSFFDEDHVPSSMVTVNGMPMDIDDQAMEEIRRKFMQMGGPNAFWKLWFFIFPPGSEGKVEFIPMRDQMGAVQSLEFAMQHFIALLNIACSVFQINPEAIGFEGIKIQRQSLNGEDPATALAYSQDKSREATLTELDSSLQESVIDRYDPDFEIRHIGAISKDLDGADKHVASLMARGFTPNAIAAANDEEPIRIPLDPDMFDEVAAKYRDNNDEPAERHARIQAEYTKRFVKEIGGPEEGLSPWCNSPNAPIGSEAMMKVYSENRQAVIQARQQKKMQGEMEKLGLPKGLDLGSAQQMQAMGFQVPGLPAPAPPGQESDDDEAADGNSEGNGPPPQLPPSKPKLALPPALHSLSTQTQDDDDEDDESDGPFPPRAKKKPAPAQVGQVIRKGASLFDDPALFDDNSSLPVIEVLIRRKQH